MPEQLGKGRRHALRTTMVFRFWGGFDCSLRTGRQSGRCWGLHRGRSPRSEPGHTDRTEVRTDTHTDTHTDTQRYAHTDAQRYAHTDAQRYAHPSRGAPPFRPA